MPSASGSVQAPTGLGGTTDKSLPADAVTNGLASYYDEYWQPQVACSNKCDQATGWCAAISININTAAKVKCGQCIKVVYGDKAAVIQVTDTCMGCSDNKLDLSTPLFKYLAGSTDKGILGQSGDTQFQWGYVPCPSK
jgi:hypothetical protein